MTKYLMRERNKEMSNTFDSINKVLGIIDDKVWGIPLIVLILATGINMLLKSTGYVSLSEYDVNIPAIIILCLLAGIYFFIRRKWKQKLSAISLILLSAVLGIVVSVIAEHIR